MVRMLAATAMLISASAAAQAVYTTRTDDGEIVLTQQPCVIGGRPVARLHEAYAYDTEGQVQRGCWASEDGRIWVHWRGRGAEVFAPSAFVARGERSK